MIHLGDLGFFYAPARIPDGLFSLFPSDGNDSGPRNDPDFVSIYGTYNRSKPVHANSYDKFETWPHTSDTEFQ